MQLDFMVVFSYWQVLAKGLALTLAFTVSCALLGSVFGFLLSLLRLSKSRWISIPTGLYVELFRGTPLLIQLFWIFFCLPVVFGLSVPPYVSVLLALTLYMTAITSETFRGALKSIPSEQHDACTALGVAKWNKVFYVIFPQALLRAVPPLLSNVVSLFKESALISSVGIADLMFVGQNISNSTARPVEFLSAVAVIYFLVAFPLTRLVGVVETRMLKRYAY
ncbi:amino acid ABC transporter permease [Pseudomonas sp. CBSPBW29]|uniref:amino acid ABC transporter permease n=1 Tax=Pseudomonas sp. CBS TaxID=2971912 RepID=UPI0021AC477A|nr:amino acid ABC transporter permease [Pseudomonas sp. CBS]WEL43557.1 amino acid ABC transporter permease [Pseudomonas sp. CBSPBW29]WEL64629.1 amino acid ABC transporter permease [Pseudomonas sp. CBSPGW29]WEL68094.1 amino acid ABC transporter permease [Pseudomonas sp. CBSPCGW29]WEL75117.1 amino acid ABC transporter permease [Pseudomonas sp. CBSPAW29]WEL80638.1 amino acid ABC transporter permease [Pseudomonas sp. CBSPCAW29]WEL89153.1 amino acid ABC transporter permease [Pseudomonas sp. CBSPCB